MKFEELRAELAKNEKLKYFTLSGYDSVRGNKLLQIYRAKWMPCKFNGQPLELHFEIQDSRILRLDCHWFPYEKFKNLSQLDMQNKFSQLANCIEARNAFIHKLSLDAQAKYQKNSRMRKLRFNALSGIEWRWEDSCDWQTIADGIAEIIVTVSPCVDNCFGKELNDY